MYGRVRDLIVRSSASAVRARPQQDVWDHRCDVTASLRWIGGQEDANVLECSTTALSASSTRWSQVQFQQHLAASSRAQRERVHKKRQVEHTHESSKASRRFDGIHRPVPERRQPRFESRMEVNTMQIKPIDVLTERRTEGDMMLDGDQGTYAIRSACGIMSSTRPTSIPNRQLTAAILGSTRSMMSILWFRCQGQGTLSPVLCIMSGKRVSPRQHSAWSDPQLK